METLTIKELAPYLPYGLKGVLIRDLRDEFSECEWVGDVNIFDKGSVWQYAGYADKDLSIPLGEGDFSGFLIRNGYSYTSVGKSIKPLLRPLSDLLQEYDLQKGYEGWESEWIEHIWDFAGKIEEANILACPYDLMQDLLSKHFDIFQLIPKGLAIDLNTIKETVK